MATLIAAANGNWSSSSSWKVCDSTAEMDSEVGSIALSTSYSYSPGFTPGAIEIDGIAVKIYSRITDPGTDTFTVCVGQGGSPVSGTEVTIDVADLGDNTGSLPSTSFAAQSYGWVFLKFASPVTLSAATEYTVGAKVSNTSSVTLYRGATSTDYARQLRTTTTQGPSAGDKLYVIGELTGSGTGNSFAIVYDVTSATDYGTGSTSLASLGVGLRGTLSFGTSASTNYRLRLSGLLWVWNGGTLNIGTVATPIPASSTAILEFDCAANGDFGLLKGNGGKVVMQGAAMTYDRAYLAADASAGASSLTTDVSTGWKSSDVIVISPSTTNHTAEKRSLSGDASGTTVNISSSLTYAKNGTAPYISEIGNFTRNVKITSVNQAYRGYVILSVETISTGTVDIDWVEFNSLGNTTTNWRYGVYVYGNEATANIQYSSFLNYYAFYGTSVGGSLTISHCLFSEALTNYGFQVSSSTADSVYSYNWFIGCATSGNGAQVTSGEVVMSYCSFSGNNYGFYSSSSGDVILNNCVIHNNGAGGFSQYNSTGDVTFTNLYVWLNGGWGISLDNKGYPILIDTAYLYGNGECNIGFNQGSGNAVIKNVQSSGSSLVGTSYFANFIGRNTSIYFYNCDLGYVATGKVEHSSRYFQLGASGGTEAYGYNLSVNAATLITDMSAYATRNFFGFGKHDGVEGSDFIHFSAGKMEHDATGGDGGGHCIKISPSSSVLNLDISEFAEQLGMFQVPAQDGVSRTVYIKLKKTSDLNSTNVSIGLFMNGTLVDGWDTCAGISDSAYTEYSVNYTPTEDGVLDFVIKLDGTAGSLYVDGFRWT